jgi:hypothetical protein
VSDSRVLDANYLVALAGADPASPRPQLGVLSVITKAH